MDVGRELDAEVAERVMGLRVVARDWPCGYNYDGCEREAWSWPEEPPPRLRSDGTPEMLIAGTLADGARYEASDEAARAWAATLALRAKAGRRVVQLELWERKVA